MFDYVAAVCGAATIGIISVAICTITIAATVRFIKGLFWD